jgi:hypothetical protein
MRDQLGKDRELAGAIEDPFLRRSVMAALHLRRYLPFYVFGTIWVVTLAAFPSIRDDADDTPPTAASAVDAGAVGSTAGTLEDTAGVTEAATDVTATDPGAAATTPSGAAGATGGAARPAAGAAKAASTAGAITAPPSSEITVEAAQSAIQRGTGTTRLGIACGPDVPQIPGATYALPCQNRYDGPNGGATYRGVTDKEVLIVRRVFPDTANSQAAEQFANTAGAATEAQRNEVRDIFIDYFNKSFELYGRKLKFVEYTSENGDSTEEAQSKGKDGACLDADKIAKELKAFMVTSGSGPFGECAAERKMMVNDAGAYFPERYFKKYHPYLWSGVTDCERISYSYAEYLGKRLLGKKAKWARDTVLQQQTRKFGIYVPDNDDYQHCVNLSTNLLKTKYGFKDSDKEQYNYVLDISRFPDQAAQAAVQFQARGVTTVVMACDPISSVVLSQAATKQQWGPEWFNIGVAANDTDAIGRLMDQTAVNGHMFGQSQLGDLGKIWGPNAEPGRLFKAITGREIYPGTDGGYFTLLGLFNKFQAAGPILTPENMAAGIRTIPPLGAPTYAVGLVSYLDGPDGTKGVGDHTGIDDNREIFWVSKGCASACTGSDPDPYFNGADGKRGTFKETYGGKRFNIGEWPAEDPPVYPARS